MTTHNYKALGPQSVITQARAIEGLTIHTQMKGLEAKLKEIKIDLVDAANGNTTTFTIPGQGTVTVTKPSQPAPTGEKTYVFDVQAFLMLSASTRRRLLSLGVAKEVDVVKGGSDAMVRYKANA